MDRNAPMDNGLCQGMCDLSTKQDPYSPDKNTPLPHYDKRRNPPLSTNRNGPYHRSSAASRAQFHTNHSRSWMLTCSHIPSMLRHHHQPWNCPTLPRLRLPMVWPTNKNDKRLRPQVYLPVQKSPHQKTRHSMKSINGIPSSNRWTLRMKEPMGGAILTTSNLQRS